MKRSSTLALLSATIAIIAPAVPAQSNLIDGVVVRIDRPAAKITIRHGPIKKFDMDEGMTMVFRVKDPKMLSMVKVGQKIRFDADRINGQFTVIHLEPAK